MHGYNFAIAYDIPGESDDDHEELLEAANLARRASCMLLTSFFWTLSLSYQELRISSVYISLASADNAFSSLFWRKMEPIFSSVSSSDISYFSQQVVTRICDNHSG